MQIALIGISVITKGQTEKRQNVVKETMGSILSISLVLQTKDNKPKKKMYGELETSWSRGTTRANLVCEQ